MTSLVVDVRAGPPSPSTTATTPAPMVEGDAVGPAGPGRPDAGGASGRPSTRGVGQGATSAITP